MLRRSFALDLRLGWRSVAVPLACLAGVGVVNLISAYTYAPIAGVDISQLGLMDNIALVFAGKPPFEYMPGVFFLPPLGWMLAVLLLAYLPLSFPYRDLMGYGQQALIREGRRLTWWMSKCLWVVLMVLCGVAVVVVTAALCTLVLGRGWTATIHAPVSLMAEIYWDGFARDAASGWPFLAAVVAVVAALCLVQLAFSLLLRPTLSFVVTLCVLLASAYAQHPLLLGNYLMLARWDGVVAGGLGSWTGMALALGLAAVAAVTGGAAFVRMDIIDKELSA